MHISRLVLNMRSRQARADAAAGYDIHRTMCTRAFGLTAGAEGRVLFRLEPAREGAEHGGPLLLVQSSGAPPDWTNLPEDYCLRVDGPKAFAPVLTAGQLLSFRLAANPVERRRRHDATGEPVRGVSKTGEPGHARFVRRALLDPDDQAEWLARQGTTRERDGLLVGGFIPRHVNTIPLEPARRPGSVVSHEQKKWIPHVGVRFDGVLEVTDAHAFLNTLAAGIGPAKAFGFGLLSIAPLRGT